MMPFGPQLSEAQQAQVEAFMAASRQAQVDDRLVVVGRWAPVFCRCARWYAGPGRPAQDGCYVHGGFMITPDGRVI